MDNAETVLTTITPEVARIAGDEMSRLWEAHGIVKLVIASVGDEPAGKAPIKPALRAAAAAIEASIDALESICTPVNLSG